MKIFMTGATGLVGQRLIDARLARGDDVIALSRSAERAKATLPEAVTVVAGDPARPDTWAEHVDGCDAVIHLAGANLAAKRWTTAYKKIIVSSRVDGTRGVVEAIGRAERRPTVLVAAAAVGYYGDTGATAVDETAPAGDGFIGALAEAWEQEMLGAEAAGVRTARLRLGVVLDPEGGALAKMIPPFKMFVGGPLGSGRQYMAWIHWSDVVGLFELALADERFEGPVNAVAPEDVTNAAFSRALGRALRRPSWLPAPAFALRLVLGEMSELLLSSQRVRPARAVELGYTFAYPKLDDALRACVRRAGA